MSYIPISPSISKSVIIFSPSLILTSRLYTYYKPGIYIPFTALNLNFNYPSLKLAIAIYRGLFTRPPLYYIPYIPI